MKRLMILMIIAVMAVTTGCGTAGSSQGTRSSTAPAVKGGESMVAQTELTQKEADFLAATFIDEDRVRKGNLTELQSYVLQQYRGAVSYLGEKYPDREFTVTSCQYQTRHEDHSAFGFVEKSDWDRYQNASDNARYLNSLWVYGDDGDPVNRIVDDYYGRRAAGTYEAYIREQLSGAVQGIAGVYVQIGDLRGSAFGENMTAEEMRTQEPLIAPAFYIFLSADAYPDEAAFGKAAEAVKNKLCSALGIRGNFTVYAVQDPAVAEKIRTERLRTGDYRYKTVFDHL